jgi:E3 ubiquitin-protein ligase RAD18
VEADTPIPKVSYAVVKEKQIRDLLDDYGLSITGDRPQLIARHERSVLLLR